MNHAVMMAHLLAVAVFASPAGAALVEHFRLDESGATLSAANSANPPNPGTLNGSFIDGDSLWTPVKINNGLRFDGSTDFVSLATPRVFTGADSWSVSFWTNNTSTATENMIIGDSTDNNDFIWYFSGNYLRYRNTAGVSYDFTAVTSFTGMNHFILTATGTSATLYRDGAFVQTLAATTTFEINSLGRGHGSFDLVGDLDDVGIWNEALPADRVEAIFNLADEVGLNYDAGEAQDLFDAFDAAAFSVVIDGTFWYPIFDGSIAGTAGDLVDLGGGDFALNLGSGNGLTTLAPPPIPEPSTLWLLSLAAFGLLLPRRKGKHVFVSLRLPRNLSPSGETPAGAGIRGTRCGAVIVTTATLAVLLGSLQAADAIELKVDFGSSNDGGPQVVDTINGWVGFATPAAGGGDPYTNLYPSALSTGTDVTVTLSGAAFLSRNRTSVTFQADLDEMLSSAIFNFGDMNLRFTDLVAGDYDVTTYHHDSTNAQSGVWDVRITDAISTALIVDTGVTSTTGITPGSVSSSSFSFTANGIDPVDILFDQTSGALTTISGITLDFTPPPLIPEPSSLLLLGLGVAGLRIRRRRRQWTAAHVETG